MFAVGCCQNIGTAGCVVVLVTQDSDLQKTLIV